MVASYPREIFNNVLSFSFCLFFFFFLGLLSISYQFSSPNFSHFLKYICSQTHGVYDQFATWITAMNL